MQIEKCFDQPSGAEPIAAHIYLTIQENHPLSVYNLTYTLKPFNSNSAHETSKST